MANVLKNKVKRVGAQISSLLGIYMSPQTESELIHGLVSRLVPYDLGIPLCRIGTSCDGGYLVPDDLDDIAYCFSPGVSDTAVFEQDLLNGRGIQSFLADYSVSSPPASLPDCDFVKKFVGAVNTEEVMTLDQWVSDKCTQSDSRDMILQMDIEGAEYETLMATSPETLSRFRIIVLELHKLNHLDNRLFFRCVDAALSKVLEQFDVAHIHANNAGGLTRMAGIDVPRVAEITLLRKDRTVRKSPVRQLPNTLDAPNVSSQQELILPNYWWVPHALSRAA